MPGIYTGPINWRWIGDQGKCQMLQGRARAYVQSLFEVVERSGAQNSWGSRQHRWVWSDFVVSATVMIDLRGNRTAWCEILVPSEETSLTTTDVVPIGLLRMEHGWLTLDLAALIADPAGTAAQVWVQSAVGGYYAGAGTLIPGSDPERARHPVGLLTYDNALTPITDWPGPAPTVTSGAHPSVHGTGAATLAYLVQPNPGGGGYQRVAPYPERYTGLARALLQDWVGGGLTPAQMAERLPEGWDLSPGVFALVRDPAPGGEHWALQATAAGLIGVLMLPGGAAADVAQWLEDGDLSGVGADLAAAYPLGALAASGLPVTLIPAEEMAPIYAGQGETIEDARVAIADDALPAGATTGGLRDSWNWSSDRAKSGVLSHVTNGVNFGSQYHYISGGSSALYETLPVIGSLSVWVYFQEGKSLPSNIGLVFKRFSGAYYHYTYWGNDAWPTLWTAYPHLRQGDVPDARGQWVQLVVSLAEMGLEGEDLHQIYYVSAPGANRGNIWWDLTEIVTPGALYGEGDAESDQGGWQWSDEIASGAIVLRRIVNPGRIIEASESRKARVDITWDDGTPSATLSPGSWAKWRPAWPWYKLWYGVDGSALSLLRNGRIYPGASDCAAVAPVLVAWNGADLKTLSYYRPVFQAAGTYSNSGSIVGCTSGDETIVGAGVQRMTGGYGWNAPTEPMYTGSGTVIARRWTIGGGQPPPCPNGNTGTADWNNVTSRWPSAGCGHLPLTANDQFPGGYDAIVDAIEALYPLTYNGAWLAQSTPGDISAQERLYTFVNAGDGGLQFLAYLAGAPDCLWELKAQTAADGSTIRRRNWTGEATYEVTLSYVFIDNVHPDGPGRAPPVCYDADYAAAQPNHGWSPAAWTVTGDETTSLGDADGTEICYRNATSIYTDQTDGDGWGPLGGDGSESAQISLLGAASAGGVLYYRPRPGAVAETIGWTGAAPTAAPTAFVGSC